MRQPSTAHVGETAVQAVAVARIQAMCDCFILAGVIAAFHLSLRGFTVSVRALQMLLMAMMCTVQLQQRGTIAGVNTAIVAATAMCVSAGKSMSLPACTIRECVTHQNMRVLCILHRSIHACARHIVIKRSFRWTPARAKPLSGTPVDLDICVSMESIIFACAL